jgi:hypothetical protein
VPGHGADQLVVRLIGEAELAIRRVIGAQQVAGRDTQQAQNPRISSSVSGSRVYSR